MDGAFIRSYDEHHFCVFDQQSSAIAWWDSFLVLGVIYSTAYTPLVIVFPQARWSYHEAADVVLDMLFTIDMLIRFRTAYRDHGYDVTHPPTIAVHYLRGWFMIDLLCSLPFDRLLSGWQAARSLSIYGESYSRVSPISIVDIVALLRVMRIGRLVRKLSALTGANFLRIMYLMYLFVLLVVTKMHHTLQCRRILQVARVAEDRVKVWSKIRSLLRQNSLSVVT